MDESEFHALADRFLQETCGRIDESGEAEAELSGGVLTLAFPSGRQLVLNKHAASRQLWLASPLQGGLHFDWDAESGAWRTRGGLALEDALSQDIAALAGA